MQGSRPDNADSGGGALPTGTDTMNGQSRNYVRNFYLHLAVRCRPLMGHVEVFQMGSVRISILRETSTPIRSATRSTDYTLVREEPHLRRRAPKPLNSWSSEARSNPPPAGPTPPPNHSNTVER